jgi:hypothetical protein
MSPLHIHSVVLGHRCAGTIIISLVDYGLDERGSIPGKCSI